MEKSEQIYEGVTPSKITTRAYANHDIHGRKRKGGESASPTIPGKGHSGKRKKKYAGHQSDGPTGEKTCLVHGPKHSTAECKVVVVVDTGHQSVRFVRIMRWWSSNLEH